MQPRPIAETSRLLFPSLRFCIIAPPIRSLTWPGTGRHRPLPKQLVPTARNAHGPLIFLGRALRFAQRLHDCRITVVEETAGFCVQRCYRRHILWAQVEIEDGE